MKNSSCGILLVAGREIEYKPNLKCRLCNGKGYVRHIKGGSVTLRPCQCVKLKVKSAS